MRKIRGFLVVFLAAVCFAQDVPRSTGWVVIPIREYETLRDKAYPTEPPAEPPAVEATLTRLDYDLRIEGALATGRAALTVDVLKEGWVRVPIPPNLLVRQASLGGKRVSLAATPGKANQWSAVLNTQGRSVLTLDLSFAVNSSGGAERLLLPTGASGVTPASLAVPSPGLDVKAGQLVVNFLEPADRSVKFTLTGETRLAREGAIAVPLLRLLETERESGGVAVEMLGAGEIKDTKTQGLEQADAAELGPLVASRQSPSVAAFRV